MLMVYRPQKEAYQHITVEGCNPAHNRNTQTGYNCKAVATVSPSKYWLPHQRQCLGAASLHTFSTGETFPYLVPC